MLFIVTISVNGSETSYEVFNSQSYDENYVTTTGQQWNISDYDLWGLLIKYYPKYDMDKNQPVYITISPSTGGFVSFNYYEDAKYSWSPEDLKTATEIMGYLDDIQPLTGALPDYDDTDRSFEVSLFDFAAEPHTKKVYFCYTIEDDKCLLECDGEYYLAAGEFYQLLNELTISFLDIRQSSDIIEPTASTQASTSPSLLA